MGLVQSCMGVCGTGPNTDAIPELLAELDWSNGNAASQEQSFAESVSLTTAPPNLVVHVPGVYFDPDDDDTPEDTETTLNNPRFAAFLIQSPSYRRDDAVSLSLTTTPTVPEDRLDELYSVIKEGNVDHFMEIMSAEKLASDTSMTSVRFENTLTPMHVAVIHGQGRIVKELMDRGAPVDEKDTLGRTPLDWAILDKNVEIQELLRAETDDRKSLLPVKPKRSRSMHIKVAKLASRLYNHTFVKPK